LKRATILLVEDNSMDIELTLDSFRQVGLTNRIEIAKNGETALDYVFGRGKYEDREAFPVPDLVLLDLKLPGISGHEVLREMKSNEPETYKIMLTDRNINMVNKIVELTKDGKKHTIAVGAGHFIGEDNMLKLLEDKGYKITRIN